MISSGTTQRCNLTHLKSGLPFEHLNLRRNPFGELELEERAALAVVDVERVVHRLKQPGYAAQFMGDCGRGKTTHLLAILDKFPGGTYVHVKEDEPLGRIPLGNPLLIDEMQRLTARQKRGLLERGVSLAIGTHENLEAELNRAGFEVETIQVGNSRDARRLRTILNRRIEWVRRRAGPVPQVSLETAREMIGRFDDHVRAIEWEMYDRFQELTEIRNV